MSKVNMANSQSALQGLSKFQAFEKSNNIFKPSGFVIFDADKQKVRRVGFFESLFTSNEKLKANHDAAKEHLIKKLSDELIKNINIPVNQNLDPYSAIQGGLDNASNKLVDELTSNNKIEKRDAFEKKFTDALDKHITATNISSAIKGEEGIINKLLDPAIEKQKALNNGAVSQKAAHRFLNIQLQQLSKNQKLELKPTVVAHMRDIAKDAAWVASQINAGTKNALAYAQIMNHSVIRDNPEFKKLSQEARLKIALKVTEAVKIRAKIMLANGTEPQSTAWDNQIKRMTKEFTNKFALDITRKALRKELVKFLKDNPDKSGQFEKKEFEKWAVKMSDPAFDQLNNAGKIFAVIKRAYDSDLTNPTNMQPYINEALKYEEYKTDPESQQKYQGLTEPFKNQAKLAIDKEIKLREFTNSSPMTDDEKIAIIDQYRELMTQSTSRNDAIPVEDPNAFGDVR